MASIRSSAPQFVVSDVVTAATYYQDVLGFRLIGFFLDPPVYAMVERDGIQIHFGKADGSQVQQSNSSLRKIGFDLYLWTDQVDELFTELEARGARITQPLIDRIYGNREFSILDCHGFKLTFGQL